MREPQAEDEVRIKSKNSDYDGLIGIVAEIRKYGGLTVFFSKAELKRAKRPDRVVDQTKGPVYFQKKEVRVI